MRISLLLFCLSLFTVASTAQHRQTVVTQMDYAVVLFEADSFSPSSSAGAEPFIGLLGGSTDAYVEVELQAGREYRIMAACDEDCADIDLSLRAEDGTVLTQDNEVDDVPIISYEPSRSGRYLLGIGMITCETELCYFGYRIFEKTVKI